jgi:hypothetical protein
MWLYFEARNQNASFRLVYVDKSPLDHNID